MRKTKGVLVSTVGFALGIAGAITLPVVPSGCAGDPLDECGTCAALGKATFACYGGLVSSARRYKGTVCDDAWAAEFQVGFKCQSEYGSGTWSVNKVVLVPCDELAGTGTGGATGGLDETVGDPDPVDCSNWNPSSWVNLDNGVYRVHGLFFESLVDDSRPLAVCDGARVEDTGSVWVVTGATSGTLLHELGLQNGDEILSINGYSLVTFGRAAFALGVEWMENLETEYTLTVKRNGQNVDLDYELWWPTF